MKKLMSLGGNYFQMTAVKAAKRLGYYVIDVDYLPQNPAHKYADEYYNISTLDREKVLEVARKKKIDGIIAYASDVSAPTAAWVAENLGLPTNPYESVYMMTRKDMFHPFLKKNGFYIPDSTPIKSEEDIHEFFLEHNENIIVKPVNSSGSKGVSHIIDVAQITEAYSEAKKYSRGEELVAEEFVQRRGYQIAGDAFIVDGEIAFFGLANEHFNNRCNSLVPVGESFPVSLSGKDIENARSEIQRAVSLLKVKNGAINLDFMFDEEGKIFVIELGPRNGGNLITDAIKACTGVDLAEYTVKAAVGDDVSDLKDGTWNRYVSSYIWHSELSGIYENIEMSDELKNRIIKSDMFVKSGDEINRYVNGGYGIGAALIEYESEKQMLTMMDHMNEYYRINVR